MTDWRQLAATHFAAEQRRVWRAEVATVAEGESARPFKAISIFRLLAMARWDDEAVFVVRNREIAMHLPDLRYRKTGLGQNVLPISFAELALTKIDAHCQHTLERRDDRRFRASGQQIGKITNRDAQGADVRDFAD